MKFVLFVISFIFLGPKGMKNEVLWTAQQLREKGSVELHVPVWHFARFENLFGKICPGCFDIRADIQRNGRVFELRLEDANYLPY